MLSMNDRIEGFVQNYHGGAAIRNREGQHLLVNSSWKGMVGDTHELTLKILISQTKDELVKTNIRHCQWCDDEVFHTQQAIAHLEVFAGKQYSTLRVPISYQGKEAVLILVEPIDLGKHSEAE